MFQGGAVRFAQLLHVEFGSWTVKSLRLVIMLRNSNLDPNSGSNWGPALGPDVHCSPKIPGDFGTSSGHTGWDKHNAARGPG